MLALLNKWFWKDEYWFPPGYSWADMKETDEIKYPQPQDLLMALPVAMVMVAVRYTFERFVGLPLSRLLGVRNQVRLKAPPNPVLEAFFLLQSKTPKEDQLLSLSRQCDLSVRQVERWFRCRRNQDRPCMTKKFCEASWRFAFYLCSFFGGLAVLHDKPWFVEPKLCWDNYPYQPLMPSLYWWYILELGFYVSLLLTLPLDVKRKDFKEQIIHHFVTITLMTFSYCANFLRIGTLVLLLHDVSDYLLEACKMFNYTQWRKVCDILFIIFALVFIVSRLVLYPTKVLYTTYYESMVTFKPFLGYYFFNGLLMVLQVLHIFWSYLILRMVYKFTIAGQMEKDERSDVEEVLTDDEREHLPNGADHLSSTSNNNYAPKSRAEGPRHLANGHLKAT
ncbi:ceramide synthase 4 [Ornithorhynchus anatinus]|nr:ceramide synthase 4 [Ornithorhynchus anatinus]XP_028907926.1 ceramide synthase 4 [Ornithorhynchus anatinus]